MRKFTICFLSLLIFNPIFSLSQSFSQKTVALSNIRYQTFGEGTPILIINGGPGMNSQGFQDVAEKISLFGFSTIIYDQRGTGNSPLEEISEILS